MPADTRNTPAAPGSRRLFFNAEKHSPLDTKASGISPAAAARASLPELSPQSPAAKMPTHVRLLDVRHRMVSTAERVVSARTFRQMMVFMVFLIANAISGSA